MPVTKCIWDEVNDTVLMESDGAGNTTAVYTQEPGPFGGLISERRGGESHFYHYDALGSTRALTDSAAQTTDSYSYAAYGSTVQASGATFVPYHFVGRSGYYHDQELATYYVRRRTYSPALARWLSRDPLARGAGVNRYRYVGNRSMNATDPSGLAGCKGSPCTTKNEGQWEEYVTKVVIGSLMVGPEVLEQTEDILTAISDFEVFQRIVDFSTVAGAGAEKLVKLAEAIVDAAIEMPCDKATEHLAVAIMKKVDKISERSSGAQVHVKVAARSCICCCGRTLTVLWNRCAWHDWRSTWFSECKTKHHLVEMADNRWAVETPVPLDAITECVAQATRSSAVFRRLQPTPAQIRQACAPKWWR